MKINKIILIVSILFLLYGVLPQTLLYMQNPDNIVVELQQCGCDCPDARIISGKLELPVSFERKYNNLKTSEVSFSNDAFNVSDITILFSQQIEISGTVVGVDTIECSINDCEVVPEMKVNNWFVHGYISKFWFFPGPVLFFYAVNLLIAPVLIICFIYIFFRNKRKTIES